MTAPLPTLHDRIPQITRPRTSQVEKGPDDATPQPGPGEPVPPRAGPRKAPRRKVLRERFLTWLPLALVLLGVAVLLYPVMATQHNNDEQQRLATMYTASVNAAGPEAIAALDSGVGSAEGTEASGPEATAGLDGGVGSGVEIGIDSVLMMGTAADRVAMRDRVGGVGREENGDSADGTMTGSCGDGERGADAGAATGETTTGSYGAGGDATANAGVVMAVVAAAAGGELTVPEGVRGESSPVGEST